MINQRIYFNQCLAYVLEATQKFENKLKDTNRSAKEELFNQYIAHINKRLDSLTPDEKKLFWELSTLISLKNKISKIDEIFYGKLNKIPEGKMIGFLGPLGAGKSTIAKVLVEDLRANFIIKEPYIANPFWQKSQENPEFMLRSQVYFLISNIISDIKARMEPGISVSDTSTLTDILMWAHWYREIGLLTSDEYKNYKLLVELLKPIIPKPDLLVILTPNSVHQLKEGIKRRQKNETVRKGELIFTTKNSRDLYIQTKEVKRLVSEIPKKWQVDVLAIEINPIAGYEDPSINYDYVYQIRSCLNLLGDLLRPGPEDVVKKIIKILAASKKRQIIVLHSQSMFTGKTTALCRLAESVDPKKILAFQPLAGLRYAGQEKAIMSRDGIQIKATTVEDNDLSSIIRYLKKNSWDSKKISYIFIDEIMLFIAHANRPETAIKALKAMQKLGFHIICDGIDFTFQEEPFNFMLILLGQTKKYASWHEIEMSTRCRYCDKKAVGTRRWKVDGNGARVKIADYNDLVFVAGDSEYEPVCCKKHKSCMSQPANFRRKDLP